MQLLLQLSKRFNFYSAAITGATAGRAPSVAADDSDCDPNSVAAFTDLARGVRVLRDMSSPPQAAITTAAATYSTFLKLRLQWQSF